MADVHNNEDISWSLWKFLLASKGISGQFTFVIGTEHKIETIINKSKKYR